MCVLLRVFWYFISVLVFYKRLYLLSTSSKILPFKKDFAPNMLGYRNNEDSDGDNATRNRARNGKKKKRSKADSDHVHHHGGNIDSNDGDQNSQTIGDRVKIKSQHTII